MHARFGPNQRATSPAISNSPSVARARNPMQANHPASLRCKPRQCLSRAKAEHHRSACLRALGAANTYGSGTFALVGAAVQCAIACSVQLLAEAFRDEPRGGKYQVGARYIFVPDRFEAYASYGNRLSGSSDEWSVIIGIRVQTAAFLP